MEEREIQLSIQGKEDDVELFLANLKKSFRVTGKPGLWIGDLALVAMGMKREPEAPKGAMFGNILFKVMETKSKKEDIPSVCPECNGHGFCANCDDN